MKVVVSYRFSLTLPLLMEIGLCLESLSECAGGAGWRCWGGRRGWGRD